jgi:protein involved in polysaccharide export with SLBB domain
MFSEGRMLKFNAAINKLRRSLVWRRFALAFAALVVWLCLASDQILAQSDSLSQIQSILQGSGSGGNGGGLLGTGGFAQSNLPPSIVLQPANANDAQLPKSRLEQIISTRAGVTLQQFGYDEFGVGQPVTVPQAGAVQDNYILGAGDEIVIALRGQENSEYRAQVDRNGQVGIPRISPILAAGRTLGDFRQDVMNAVSRAYISTQAFVSVGQLRQISVFVTGEVNAPGMRLVTGLSSPADAILLSGGIKKTGSLRNVRVVHGNTETIVDLYGILTRHGGVQQILLTDGDRIVVPPLGPTVAAAGWFRRPGIYELPSGTENISVRSLIALAGGLEVRGQYRLSELRTLPDGANSLIGLKSQIGTIRDGDLLFAIPGADQTVQQTTLSGGLALAGQYAVGRFAKLSDLLNAPGALGPHPYTLFGLVVRRDPITKFVSLIPFSPAAVLEGRSDLTLNSNDVVRVFTQNEALLLSAVVARFEKERTQLEENLHSPIDVLQTQQNNGVLQDMQANQSTDRGFSERRIIGVLSAKTLGDGGVLSDRLPTNEYPPFGLTPDQTTYLANAAPPNVATMYSQGPNGEGPQSSGNLSSLSSANGSLSGSNGSLTGANSSLNGGTLASANSSLTAFAGSKSHTVTNQQPGFGFGNGNSTSTVNQIQPSAALPTAYLLASAPNFQDAGTSVSEFPLNETIETFGQLVRQLQVDPVVLMHFLNDRKISISGSSLGAGLYLVGPQTTVHDLIAAAGGTSEWTDISRVELISSSVSPQIGSATTEHRIVALTDPGADQYELHPRDELRLNEIDTKLGAGAVTIQGQVHYTGTYNIERGERLSELLLRAGGLTDVAYPYGTVFLRQSAATAEREGYRREANEVQNIIATGLSRIGQDKISPDAFTALNTFAEELKTTQALGRISVVADPATLAADPTRDPLLEPGDVIFIPQRPSTVTVLGQVNQPGTFIFSANASVDDYINRAGGYNALSDKSLTFVILPDGTARPVDSSWLSFSSESLTPGSTIVVQRDVAPIDTRQLILDVAGIMQSLAVSAASLAVLHNN